MSALRPEIPDNSHDALARCPGSPQDHFQHRCPGLLLASTNQGYYIAALKRIALRLTREPDAHRAKCIERRARPCLNRILSSAIVV